MKTASECLRKAGKCKRKATIALTDTQRAFLLDAAGYWKVLAAAVKAEPAPPPASDARSKA